MAEGQDGTEQSPISKLASRSRMRVFILLAITVLGLILCYLLLIPFLPALTWAMALAILFAPAHRWLEAKLKRPNLAATISVAWIGLMVVIQTIFLGSRLIAEAARGASTIKEKAASGEWRRGLEGHPALAIFTEWIDQVDLPGAVGNVASWLATASTSLVRSWLLQLTIVVLTFYLLFYFLRDRNTALGWFKEISHCRTPK